ncbi:Transcription initiation factor TFIID subunit 6 [Toxocara canis]|uniref:Signal peptidase complex subunit 2 n=1 Tax=Toxocara canis TaxID=6265 RepID=A0A0B2UZF9_TOXCA|nr:Transcription initiation factor TFIID subunit 6 [Toxocara canis]
MNHCFVFAVELLAYSLCKRFENVKVRHCDIFRSMSFPYLRFSVQCKGGKMPSKSGQSAAAASTTSGNGEIIKVNKWDGPTVKNTLDDAIRKILNDKFDTWTEKHWLADGRLIISTVAVAFAGFALIYDYLEPFPKSKAILNDKFDTWTEKHWLADGRLIISTVAVAFAGFALIYDYLEPFPKSKAVLATCSITYFILMGVLQLYQWYMEKGTFYQAVDEDPTGRQEKRYWKWSSTIKKYDDKYTLEAEYYQGSRTGQMKDFNWPGHICGTWPDCMVLFISEIINVMTSNHTATSRQPVLPQIDGDFVRVVSEQVGIVSLSNDCCKLAADHITYRIKLLLESAKKLAVHGRRIYMTMDDIDRALGMVGKEALLGHGSNRKCVVYKSVTGSAETLDHEVFVVEDPEIDMAAALKKNIGRTVIEDNPDTAFLSSRRELVAQVPSGASVAYRLALRATRKAERINIKPSSSHQLSLEQQYFFKEVMEACVGLDDKRRVEALESLQIDTGLQSLLPNISKWLAQGVRANLIQQSLAMLIYIVRAHSALIHNRSLDINPVLHEMVPSLLSCMVSRQLCSRPDVDNHWTLRDFASKCLVQLRAAIYPHYLVILRSVHPNVTASMPQQQRIDAEKLYGLLSVINTKQLLKCITAQHQVRYLCAVHWSLTESMTALSWWRRMRAPISDSEMPGDQNAINGGHFNGASTSANSSGSSSLPGTSSAEAECGAEYVKTAAETIGISNLSEQCASHIGASTTYVVKEVLEQAKKFAAHGRRKRVIADDFDAALAFKGYAEVLEQAKKFAAHGRRKRVIADDFDAALAFKGYAPLFGFSSKEGVPFRLVGSTGRDLFVSDDHDIDLATVVNAPLAKVPVDTTVKAHWLVIDGEQPAVPENPTPILEEDASASAIVERIEATEQGPTILSQAAKMVRKTEQVQIKTMTTHALSVEQQIFFKEITEAIMGSDDARRTEALHSLQTDAGIQVLLPRFSLAIAEGVRCNIVHHNLAILIYLMRMIQSLASNPALCLDRCLHELLPSILSCILSKQLCARPDTDNHWALREFSSRLLSTICRAYNVNGLRSRITQVLTRVWRDEHSTLSTLYGSLYALNELGVDTIRAVVIPRAPQLSNDIKKAQSDKSNAADRIAADKIQNFVTKVLTNYVRTQRPTGLKDVNDYRSMFGGFGDAIFRAISIEMTHTSTTSIGIGSSLSSGNVNSVGSSVQRPAADRRPLGATPLTIRAVVIPRAPQLSNDIKKAQSDKSNAADRIAADKIQNFVTKVLTNYVRTQRPTGLKDVNDYRSMFGGFGDAIFRAISIEMTHTSTTSIGIGSSLSSGNVNSVGSSVQRPAADRRPLGATPLQQQQRLNIVRAQGTQQIRQQPVQQSYVSVSTGGRLQAAASSQRSASPASFYVGGASNTSAGSFVVRPSSVKKLVVSSGQQRTPGGPAGDSYRNN